jgi:hypothetical protein
LSQERVIIDFAIEGDNEPAALRHHWLPARLGEVDDREPAMAERDPGVSIKPAALAIRPAMAQAGGHSANRSQVSASGDLR